MQSNREENLEQKMVQITELIEKDSEPNETKVELINYYKEFEFKGSGLFENDVFVAKVKNEKRGISTYEIYSEKTGKLIALVNEEGKINFREEYIESLRKIDERYIEQLELEDLDFELPQELGKEDIIKTREEIEDIKEKIIGRDKENTQKSNGVGEKENKEEVENEKAEQKKEELAKEKELSEEEAQRENIAKQKNIPSNNVLFIKENSNFYKDHPNLEKNLYFFRDNDGTVKAEYIDNNGKIQPSKYFEASNTSLRQETVSLGNNGETVKKEVPYQVMKTKGLNNVDKDIVDIRINIKIDSYGYLDIEEARQGKNGEWLSHDIEVKGRDYNSNAVNKATSLQTREADPDKQTESYEQASKNEFALQDGIQYSEMELMEHAEEIMEYLVKEGYQKEEAVDIFNYMIGDENLSLKDAQERENEAIKEQNSLDENEKARETVDETIDGTDAEPGGRTPGDDAWERLQRIR